MNTYFENNSSLIIGVLIIAGFLIVGLVVYVLKLNKKISKIQKPKYGFAGKSIYSILTLMIIGISIPVTIILLSSPTDFRHSAQQERKLEVIIDQVIIDEVHTVYFSVVPYDFGKPEKSSFDVYWKVVGPINFEKEELYKSEYNPSYFSKELPSGSYDISVEVKFNDGEVIVENKNIYIE